jgi:hypothetical protein
MIVDVENVSEPWITLPWLYAATGLSVQGTFNWHLT